MTNADRESVYTSKVYIVDDDELIRDSIGLMLQTLNIPHELFADAQSFLDALSLEIPGVAVLDIRLPGMSGLELQKHLAELGAQLPIIFITGHGDVEIAVDAMKHGAVELLQKPFREQQLLDCINETLKTAEAQFEASLDIQALKQKAASLTPREQQVFEAISQGHANKVIAIDLNISERTVELHRSQLMKKMEVRSVASLVRSKMLLELSQG